MNLASYLELAVGQLLGLEVRQPILPTVYETSWAVNLTSPEGETLYPTILEDLATSQHPDGSWGSKTVYYHDRVLSTLAMVLVLARFGHRSEDNDRRRAGERYLWQNTFRLRNDPHRTVGFELILPALLAEGESLGLDLPYTPLSPYDAEREKKLALLPADAPFGSQNSALFSLEAFPARVKQVDPQRMRASLLDNGSVATSPSATAFMLTARSDRTESFPQSEDYLRTLLEEHDGGLPTVSPCDIFIRAWMLNYLYHGGLLGNLGEHVSESLNSIQRYLLANWRPRGVGWASNGPVESDDTAMVLLALSRAGYEVDGSCLLYYERAEHFAVLEYERDPSVSVNLHILEALDTLPTSERERVRQKIVSFLLKSRRDGSYWRDKWHASAYYPTSRALLVLSSHLSWEQLDSTVHWMLVTQHANGSWGEYGPTSEETALVLLSLLHYHRHVRTLPKAPLRLAASYLMSVESPFLYNYQELWVSKTLYAPAIVIKSIVVAALGLYADTFEEDNEIPQNPAQLSGNDDNHQSEDLLDNDAGSWSK